MRLNEVAVDSLVCVNDLPDTTVYTVVELRGYAAHLMYDSGYKRVSGGWLDVAMLQKPTKAQLANSGLS